MAAQVPSGLKAANILWFARRAAQLEKAKPIIAYWCEYWIVSQILSKGLDHADQECLAYTTTLMDKLEQFKAENAEEPAVTDDVVGKAYVEEFALETYERADNALRASKASRQTADTFQAAATFLELLQIWGPVDTEIAAQIKYAKYHAWRIAKALKAGEDPNLSQLPGEEQLHEQEGEEGSLLPPSGTGNANTAAPDAATSKPRQPSIVEVPDEADRLQRSLAQTSSLDESLHPSRDTSLPPAIQKHGRQPSVVEVPDEADRIQRNLARQSSLDESLHPSRTVSLPPSPAYDGAPSAAEDASAFYSQVAKPPSINMPLDTSSERKASVGGSYFPPPPPPPADLLAPGLPSAPGSDSASLDLSVPPLGQSVQRPSGTALSSLNQPSGRQSPPPPAHRHGRFLPGPGPGQAPQIPPDFPPQPAPSVPQIPPQLRQPHGPVPQVPQVQASAWAPPPPADIVVDEEAMMKAQKHARWAISALNFEDVPTAIKELRGALKELGAT